MKWTLLLASLTVASPSQVVPPGIRVPDGFEVVEFANQLLADDIIRMTRDPRGRIVVAGRGYIRILVDDNGDGRADRAIEFANGPRDGAMGMLWEGDTLYIVGDGGLRRYRDRDGDDRADGPSELIRAMKTGGEHTAHALRRAADGWLYLLAGDHAGIDRNFATASTSPIRDPIGGCVVRFSPDFCQSEILADGFRNAYGMDFNSEGELFTFDSDNERCVSLPWYEPTRFYHVVPGGHHGWLGPQRAAWFRLPPYLPDVVAPVVTLGRGSPTGVVGYRHRQFPKKYRDSMFALDWTFGKVWHVPLVKSGNTYTSMPEPFLEATGDNGFAPTDALVHPTTGDLFVSIGGRGTRGAVYRIRYPRGLREFRSEEIAALQPRTGPRSPSPGPVAPATVEHALKMLADAGQPTRTRLSVVRRLQLEAGDLVQPTERGTVWAGYSPRDPARARQLADRMPTAATSVFPAGQPDLDRELSRFFALLEIESTGLLDRIAAQWTNSSNPVEDIHYLIVLGRLPGARSVDLTARTAAALLRLDAKLDERKQQRDTHWPLRMAELQAGLVKRDPKLNAALLDSDAFGRPDHALFARANGFDRARAAERFLQRSQADSSFAWNANVVSLLGELPATRTFPILRQLWGEAGLDDAILPVLAKHPDRADREKFVAGLASPQPSLVATCLDALEKLSLPLDGNGVLGLLRAAQRGGTTDAEKALRDRLVRQLQRVTGQSFAGDDRATWSAWFTKAYPALAARLDGPDNVDLAAWQARLSRLDWSAGDANLGQQVFVKASCASCHSGSQALGPDLAGIANRFSRDDLFTAILQPSRDISARYRTTVLATDDGKVYQGLIIYDAVDGVILQTGVANTVRVPGVRISGRRTSDISLMPAGLLDRLTDREVADLYAYLRSKR